MRRFWFKVMAILAIQACPFAASVRGRDLEAGLHTGLAISTDDTILGTESGWESGVWLIVWPTDRLAMSADWSYVPRDDFSDTIGMEPVGEKDRNRQYVDLTLQYHWSTSLGLGFFVELGGGALWNNRQVINPRGVPNFEEQGNEHTLRSIWTIGGGFRRRLLSHLNWIVEGKFHNPGSDSKGGFRLMSGITVSWK